MAPDTETVDIVIQSLINAGVKYVFGVPGAKIVSYLNLQTALLSPPCLHLPAIGNTRLTNSRTPCSTPW